MVKCPTLGFGSGHDPRVMGLSPTSGSSLSTQSACDSLTLRLFHSSLILFLKKLIKMVNSMLGRFYHSFFLKGKHGLWIRLMTSLVLKKKKKRGQPGWLSSLAPPSAQGLILETLDRVPRRAPCMEPASPSACVSTLSLIHI